MKKLSKTETELKKALLIKRNVTFLQRQETEGGYRKWNIGLRWVNLSRRIPNSSFN